jgi:hypothetical protein
MMSFPGPEVSSLVPPSVFSVKPVGQEDARQRQLAGVGPAALKKRAIKHGWSYEPVGSVVSDVGDRGADGSKFKEFFAPPTTRRRVALAFPSLDSPESPDSIPSPKRVRFTVPADRRYSALNDLTAALAHLPDDSASDVEDLGLTVSAERPDVLPEGALILVPRAPWMLEGDSRSDAEADADWYRGTQWLSPDIPYHIVLIYQSTPKHYEVLSTALISQVVSDAAVIFALDPSLITLLSGGRMLSLTDSLSDPPAIMSGAHVYVIVLAGPDGHESSSTTQLLGEFHDMAVRGGFAFSRFDASHAYSNHDGDPDSLSSRGPLQGRQVTARLKDLKEARTDLAHKTFHSGPHLNTKQIRRILTTRESIFKYGIYLPKNDRDADASPERARWYSGRQLEWLRLKDVRAFEYDWTLSRLLREFPDYKVKDIGHCFYIYDYKFSGEHRVRLVFDGSRQSPSTYDDTYSLTVRPESIRLFHVYAVEMG